MYSINALEYLLSQDIGELRGGLMAYICMLDGPSHDQLFPLVTQALPTINNLLMHSGNRVLQEISATALEKTAELIPAVFFQESIFTDAVREYAQALASDPRVFYFIKDCFAKSFLDFYAYRQIMASYWRGNSAKTK